MGARRVSRRAIPTTTLQPIYIDDLADAMDPKSTHKSRRKSTHDSTASMLPGPTRTYSPSIFLVLSTKKPKVSSKKRTSTTTTVYHVVPVTKTLHLSTGHTVFPSSTTHNDEHTTSTATRMTSPTKSVKSTYYASSAVIAPAQTSIFVTNNTAVSPITFAGIGIAAAVAAIVLGLLIFFLYRRRRQRKAIGKQLSPTSSPERPTSVKRPNSRLSALTQAKIADIKADRTSQLQGTQIHIHQRSVGSNHVGDDGTEAKASPEKSTSWREDDWQGENLIYNPSAQTIQWDPNGAMVPPERKSSIIMPSTANFVKEESQLPDRPELPTRPSPLKLTNKRISALADQISPTNIGLQQLKSPRLHGKITRPEMESLEAFLTSGMAQGQPTDTLPQKARQQSHTRTSSKRSSFQQSAPSSPGSVGAFSLFPKRNGSETASVKGIYIPETGLNPFFSPPPRSPPLMALPPVPDLSADRVLHSAMPLRRHASVASTQSDSSGRRNTKGNRQALKEYGMVQKRMSTPLMTGNLGRQHRQKLSSSSFQSMSGENFKSGSFENSLRPQIEEETTTSSEDKAPTLPMPELSRFTLLPAFVEPENTKVELSGHPGESATTPVKHQSQLLFDFFSTDSEEESTPENLRGIITPRASEGATNFFNLPAKIEQGGPEIRRVSSSIYSQTTQARHSYNPESSRHTSDIMTRSRPFTMAKANHPMNDPALRSSSILSGGRNLSSFLMEVESSNEYPEESKQEAFELSPLKNVQQREGTISPDIVLAQDLRPEHKSPTTFRESFIERDRSASIMSAQSVRIRRAGKGNIDVNAFVFTSEDSSSDDGCRDSLHPPTTIRRSEIVSGETTYSRTLSLVNMYANDQNSTKFGRSRANSIATNTSDRGVAVVAGSTNGRPSSRNLVINPPGTARTSSRGSAISSAPSASPMSFATAPFFRSTSSLSIATETPSNIATDSFGTHEYNRHTMTSMTTTTTVDDVGEVTPQDEGISSPGKMMNGLKLERGSAIELTVDNLRPGTGSIADTESSSARSSWTSPHATVRRSRRLTDTGFGLLNMADEHEKLIKS